MNFTPNEFFTEGIGDDAAIRHCHQEQLIFTGDTLIENVHFSLQYMDLKQVGFKAMVVNLSDCAAMGAIPDSALVQLIIPESCGDYEKHIVQLYEGFFEACSRWHFPIIGGNLSRGPCWIIAITLTGRCSKDHRILKRTGVEIGDTVWTTGIPGRSGAGCSLLRHYNGDCDNIPHECQELVRAHICPVPRIEIGNALSDDSTVHAAIDLSDGIAKECATLCFENDVGMVLELTAELVPSSIVKASSVLNVQNAWKWFLYGGEDYELLFTASDAFDPLLYKKWATLYKIGKVTCHNGKIMLINTEGNRIAVEQKGWDHFKKINYRI